MNNQAVLARRYATAFINVHADELHEEVIIQLNTLLAFLKERTSVRTLLNIPVLSQDEQLTMLARLFDYYKLDSVFKKLGALLVHDARVNLLKDVLWQVQQLYAAYRGIYTCAIRSSHALKDEQTRVLVAFIEQKISKKIIYDIYVDPLLIAGISVCGKTFFWEHSVRRRLDYLQEPLIRKGYYERY